MSGTPEYHRTICFFDEGGGKGGGVEGLFGPRGGDVTAFGGDIVGLRKGGGEVGDDDLGGGERGAGAERDSFRSSWNVMVENRKFNPVLTLDNIDHSSHAVSMDPTHKGICAHFHKLVNILEANLLHHIESCPLSSELTICRVIA